MVFCFPWFWYFIAGLVNFIISVGFCCVVGSSVVLLRICLCGLFCVVCVCLCLLFCCLTGFVVCGLLFCFLGFILFLLSWRLFCF